MSADPTPTTVGVIQGKVKLDSSGFFAEVQKVRQEVAALKRDDPSIRVEADTAEAMARLKAVQAAAAQAGRATPNVSPGSSDSSASRPGSSGTATAVARTDSAANAQRRLADAEKQSERATAQAVIAQMRLQEVQAKGARSAAQLAAAEEAARFAIEKSEGAAARAAAAEEALAHAQAEAAKKALEEAGAQEVAAKATAKQGAAAKDAGGQTHWLALAIMGLGPAAVPAAAAATGVAGALGVMGGAGVLAVLGIKRAMKDGTADGVAYRRIFAGMQQDVERLETTAQHGLMPGLSASANVLEAAMPTLNREVGTFGQMLGHIAPTALDAVVTMLGKAEPLLDASGKYLVTFVDGLDGFAHSTAFEHFVSYAVTQLPALQGLIGDALTFAGRFLTEMAPYGQTMLALVDGVLRFGTVIAPIAPLVWGVTTAILAVNTAGKLIDGVTAAMARLGVTSEGTAAKVATVGEAETATAAKGRGLSAATLGLAAGTLAVAYGAGAAGHGIATASGAEGTTDAYNGMSNRQAVAQLMAQTSGVLGGGSLKQLASTPQWLQDVFGGWGGNLAMATGGAGAGMTMGVRSKQAFDTHLAQMTTGGQGAGAAEQFKAVQAALEKEGKTAAEVKAMFPQYAAAVDAAGVATDGFGNVVGSTTTALDRQVAAINQASTAMLKNAQQGQSMETSEDQARDAVDALTKQLRAKGATLNQDTADGRANREMTAGATGALLAHAQAINSDGKHAAASRAYVVAHARALEQQMIAAGADKGAVVALVGALMGVSKTHPVSKIDVEKADAEAKIAHILENLNNLDGTTATVYVNAVAGGIDPAKAAQLGHQAGLAARGGQQGGTAGSARFGHLAFGGTGGTVRGPGTALSDTAGLYQLANGEEVISNARGQADQWRPLLKAINAGKAPRVDLGKPKEQVMTVKTVNLGGVHLHSPVAQDPVQSAEDASQLIQAYAGYPL